MKFPALAFLFLMTACATVHSHGQAHRCHDALTPIGWTVPFSTTVGVTGGGTALDSAVQASSSGTRIQINDSLDYTSVLVSNKTNLTIEAGAGQTPTITAPPGSDAGNGNHCIKLAGACSFIGITGITMIGTGNVHPFSQPTDGLLNGAASIDLTALDHLIVSNCVFMEQSAATVGNSVPGIQITGTDGSLHHHIAVQGCTFRNNAAGPDTGPRGYGACTIAGCATVFIQNSVIRRDDAVIARTSSNMRGFTWKSIGVTVEDCLVDDIGPGASAFKHHDEAIFGTAIGDSFVRNCVTTKAGAFRISLVGTRMTVKNCVAYTDSVGLLAGRNAFGSIQAGALMTVRDSVAYGQSDGVCFGQQQAGDITEDHNDVFNWGTIGLTLDPTDLTVDPLLYDQALHEFDATSNALKHAASDGKWIGLRYAIGTAIIWCGQ
jgi:hypothetical protein